MSDKNKVRKRVKETLSNLSKPQYEAYSKRIADTLLNDNDWKTARVIGIYISNPPEVDTYQIIRKAWEQGKQVVVPKCRPADKQLSFRALSDFTELESVYYGLLEPVEALTKEITSEGIDLLVVPGLAYTKEGYRLGFGGGYYDRFLTNYHGKTLSLAFKEQIISNFPIEAHDIPVSKLITNDGVIETK
ncbi:5-formyltetrahydrofolate cyclo-ligase [Bacillus sp. USDA818B3_A]|uniref:5-formyltetrahydrofolate cyclo-ligase n=1 Tax=Bacillus sp. USDA818B3_A TaxID=2698834 RepID=UPI001367BB46|nr:5-formyltetrahydrofolate cyclo-ligase [Bacillus sp. USDA818B3_A]